MTFGTDANVITNHIFIARIFNIKTEGIVFCVLVEHIKHKLSAVGTVDAWLSFAFWI